MSKDKKVSTSQGPGSHFDHAQHDSNTKREGASAPSPQCTLDDLRLDVELYSRSKVDENGESVEGTLDTEDAYKAAGMAAAEYYCCQKCGDEWHEWKEAKAHLGEAA